MKKKRIFYIIVPITVFIIAFIALDILLGTLYLPDVRHYRKPHEYYHHGLVSNVSNVYSKWANQVYKISTNSLGFRDSISRNISNRSDNYRILLIGDSFTEALGVDWNDSFAGILFNRLENRGIEILNAGVIGYSPRIYYLKTEHLLNIRKLRFDELFVFLFAFTFAKRLSPRQKRRDPSLPDEIPGGRLRRRPRSIVVSSERTEIDKVCGCCGLYRP